MKRIRMGVYGGQFLFDISRPGYNVDTANFEDPMQMAFSSRWDKSRYLTVLQQGVVFHSQTGATGGLYGVVDTSTLINLPLYDEPVAVETNLYLNNRYFDNRLVKTKMEAADEGFIGFTGDLIAVTATLRESRKLYIDSQFYNYIWVPGSGYRITTPFNIPGPPFQMNIRWTIFRLNYSPGSKW